MKKHLLLFPLLMAACAASARIGESETQLENRFGGSQTGALYTELPTGTNVRKYHKNGYTITVAFYKGRSVKEEYEKGGASFSPDEISTILQNNSPNSAWLQKSDDDHFTVWETKDATLSGVYQKPVRDETELPLVSVESSSFFELRRAGADKKRGNDATGL